MKNITLTQFLTLSFSSSRDSGNRSYENLTLTLLRDSGHRKYKTLTCFLAITLLSCRDSSHNRYETLTCNLTLTLSLSLHNLTCIIYRQEETRVIYLNKP